MCLAPPAEEVLGAAIERHRAGRLAEAAALCEAVLAADGTNVDALHLLGSVHHQRGDHARAAELFGQAVGLRPDFAAAHNDLGIALQELGRLDEAVGHFRRAVEPGPDRAASRTGPGQVPPVAGRAEGSPPHREEAGRLRSDLAAYHNNLGNALQTLGRLGEARAAYLDAIRLDPGLAVAYAHLGLVSLQEDRIDEAGRLLARAAELEPDRPIFWEYLAGLHERLEQFDAAVACWERVLALVPDDRAHPHLALGLALHEEGRLDEAVAHYRTAAAIDPGSVEARLSLGLYHEARGEFAEAEADFRAAIRLQPTSESALALLATLLRDKLPAADLDALVARLDDPATAEGPRIQLLFALGHVLDARGDHARAAGSFREANARALARAPRRSQPAEYDRFVDGLIGAFGPGFFARAAGAGLDTRRPIFVVGLPRSGTTLVEQVLASHPRVHGAGELPLGRRMFERLPAVLDPSASPMDCVPRLNAATIRGLAEAYLDRLRALAGDRAERVIDKMPENYLYLGLLTALFPGASVIHCRRDLRDVALSCWMTDFRSVTWAHDPGHIAVVFRAYLRLMDHWRAVLPATIHEVDYEETVSDLEGVARRLLAALDLGWDPACLEFHRTSRPILTGSVTQVRQPLYKRSVARWKRYEHELADLFAALPRGPGRAS